MIKRGSSYHVESNNTFYEMSSTKPASEDANRIGCFVVVAIVVVVIVLALSASAEGWMAFLNSIH